MRFSYIFFYLILPVFQVKFNTQRRRQCCYTRNTGNRERRHCSWR